jgi:hypothetical protein
MVTGGEVPHLNKLSFEKRPGSQDYSRGQVREKETEGGITA